MPRLAFYTFGLLKHPYSHPNSQEFIQKAGEFFELLPRVPGFISMVRRDEHTPHPRHVDKEIHFPAATLTVWKDLKSAWNFTYRGVHFESMDRRHEWVENAGNPAYVSWSMADDEEVTYEEAIKRYEYFLDNGPTPLFVPI